MPAVRGLSCSRQEIDAGCRGDGGQSNGCLLLGALTGRGCEEPSWVLKVFGAMSWVMILWWYVSETSWSCVYLRLMQNIDSGYVTALL